MIDGVWHELISGGYALWSSSGTNIGGQLGTETGSMTGGLGEYGDNVRQAAISIVQLFGYIASFLGWVMVYKAASGRYPPQEVNYPKAMVIIIAGVAGVYIEPLSVWTINTFPVLWIQEVFS